VVVLDAPDKSVLIPAGEYYDHRVYLDGGESAGLFYATCKLRLLVREDAAETLKLGGPLNHSVRVMRHGNVLDLGYVLLGAGDEVYQSADSDWDKAPTVAIYQGDRKLASGRFEYG
jgi:hypothetical protein